jgi:large subunit ribosomal protein L23
MPAHANAIIKRPLVTEKSTWQSDERKTYAFEVDRLATKDQIRVAVTELYNVRVLGVRTQVRKGIYKRTRYGMTRTPDLKRALVQLHPEDKIELV